MQGRFFLFSLSFVPSLFPLYSLRSFSSLFLLKGRE